MTFSYNKIPLLQVFAEHLLEKKQKLFAKMNNGVLNLVKYNIILKFIIKTKITFFCLSIEIGKNFIELSSRYVNAILFSV